MADISPVATATTPAQYSWDADSSVPLAAMVLGIDEEAPVRQTYAPAGFPGGAQIVLCELYADGNWVASLREEESVFSDGATMADAVTNMISSAREDLDILSEYGESVTAHLRRKRQYLEGLFNEGK